MHWPPTSGAQRSGQRCGIRIPAPARGRELKQVWFAGVHRDAGGGYKGTGLSDIALLWMVGQVRRHGMEFDADALSTDGPRVIPPQGSIGFRVRPDGSGLSTPRGRACTDWPRRCTGRSERR
ncbi:phospholipase effector Tle1 domain-containing protein [Streptomyces sp. KMM 9044]|uniref:phospholipase effector Tle1 domain-containing protein n=1 Tax=Streptomyces sp. KMM 9044 TaxID=2744474 RepID=UPI003FA70A24